MPPVDATPAKPADDPSTGTTSGGDAAEEEEVAEKKEEEKEPEAEESSDGGWFASLKGLASWDKISELAGSKLAAEAASLGAAALSVTPLGSAINVGASAVKFAAEKLTGKEAEDPFLNWGAATDYQAADPFTLGLGSLDYKDLAAYADFGDASPDTKETTQAVTDAGAGIGASADSVYVNMPFVDYYIEKGTLKGSWNLMNKDGRESTIETIAGQAKHTGPGGQTTTVNGQTIHSDDGNGTTYDKNKETGLETETGQGWKVEETADGKRIMTRADGARMEITMGRNDQPREAVLTLPDGTKQVMTHFQMARMFGDGRVTIIQNRGPAAAPDATEDPAAKAARESEQGVIAGVENEGETGVVRYNLGDITMYAHQDGRKVFELQDGSRVRVNKDGSYQVLNAEGEPAASSLVEANDDGTLLVRDSHDPSKSMTVTLTGEGAGVVTTSDGSTIAGQTNTVTTTAGTTGTVAVLETQANGSSTLTEGNGCELNPDGTPKRKDDGAVALEDTTRVTAVDITTAAVVSGDPDNPTPDLRTAEGDPTSWIWESLAGVNPFKWHWGNGSAEDPDTLTTPSLTKFIGDVWDGVTRLWDNFAEIAGDTYHSLVDGLSIDGALNIFADGDLIGTASYSDDAASAAATVSSATTTINQVAGLTANNITSGHVGALRSDISALSVEIGRVLAGAAAGDPAAMSALAALQGARNAALAQLSRAENALSTQAQLEARMPGATGSDVVFAAANPTLINNLIQARQLETQGVDEKGNVRPDLLLRIDRLTA